MIHSHKLRVQLGENRNLICSVGYFFAKKKICGRNKDILASNMQAAKVRKRKYWVLYMEYVLPKSTVFKYCFPASRLVVFISNKFFASVG